MNTRSHIKNYAAFAVGALLSAAAFAAEDIAWKYDTTAREQSVPAPVVAASAASAVNTVGFTTCAGSAAFADGCFWMLANEATLGGTITLYMPGLLLLVR